MSAAAALASAPFVPKAWSLPLPMKPIVYQWSDVAVFFAGERLEPFDAVSIRGDGLVYRGAIERVVIEGRIEV